MMTIEKNVVEVAASAGQFTILIEAAQKAGLAEALSIPNSMVRIFGKPSTRPFRRMGVGLYSSFNESEEEIREKAAIIAAQVVIA